MSDADAISIDAQTVEAELQMLGLRDIVTRCRSGKIKRSEPDIARYAQRLLVAEAIVSTLRFVQSRQKAREAVNAP